MIDFVVNYWAIIIALIAVIILGIILVKKFLDKPTAEQIITIKAWLLAAVTDAEKDLGSKMGRVKLSKVYDMFLNTFPKLSNIVTFAMFSKLVDEALEEMRKIITSNKRMQEYVGIEESPKSEELKMEEETISTLERE